MQVELYTEPSQDSSMTECAIRLLAPDTSTRNPVHIIFLIDISTSMDDDNKLENVKQCCSNMLQFLNEQDRISLITFGETGTLHLQRVAADETNKTSIRDTIQRLCSDGCTNLSAGLGHVHTVCQTSGPSIKTGLLLLTDGHANRGVSDPIQLRSLMRTLRKRYEQLSIQCMAYGVDHNQELLRGFAEDNAGSYNVVNSIEDTAFAFGDALGGLMSCAFQNVVLQVPADTNVHGPWVTTHSTTSKTIQVGDVYSGTKPLVLCTIPTATLAVHPNPIVCKGMELPTFQPFTITPTPTPISSRMSDIELTRLRYKCTELLRTINTFNSRVDDASAIQTKIDEFERAVHDTFFDGHPIANLLRHEVAVLRNLLSEQQYAGYSTRQTLSVVAEQHIASIGLARGFSSPMAHHRRHRRRSSTEFGWGGVAVRTVDSSDDENPVSLVPDSTGSAETPIHLDESTFQNSIQRQMATLMRHASQPSNDSSE